MVWANEIWIRGLAVDTRTPRGPGSTDWDEGCGGSTDQEQRARISHSTCFLAPYTKESLAMVDAEQLNQRVFARESPYLDALLVFAGLFSAILAAFLIEVNKGLQEDLLDKILQELRRTDEPFHPDPISVWVTGLWFASLSVSLAAALFVILAKAMGRRVVDTGSLGEWRGKEPESSSLEAQGGCGFDLSAGHGERLDEPATAMPEAWRNVRLTKAHSTFKRKFELLTMAATISISVSLALFYPGLVVLVYSSQKGIGACVACVAAVMGVLAFVSSQDANGSGGRGRVLALAGGSAY
ncbi:hypothetical protein DFP72DRAFT_852518 [Ephemerocybe angulata]|uniref:DUF6535 domain-containing protein n=1 Tax=Ephemerocybe angulata TaxID=980116 RepID=A0A8H6HMV4_9AGAR|nr:hypothetical protein DFP72DRAFT_852518 [Tulosesus angulatus]